MASLLLLALAPTVSARIPMKISSGYRECVFLTIRELGSQVLASHSIETSSTRSTLSVTVTDAVGTVVYTEENVPESRIIYRAATIGTHSLCVSSLGSDAVVAFTFLTSSEFTSRRAHGVAATFSALASPKSSAEAGAPHNGASFPEDPLERAAERVAVRLTHLAEEQRALRTREHADRRTAQSALTAITVGGVLASLAVVGSNLAILTWLRRHFQTTRHI